MWFWTVISSLGKELLEVASLRILVNDFEKHLEGSVLDQEDVWLPNPCLVWECPQVGCPEKRNTHISHVKKLLQGQPALLQMGKTRVLPSLVEQELNLIMLGKQRSLVWKSVFSGQLTKLDSSGLWRERRVIPIFTGIGRFTGGLSRLSYLNNLSYFLSSLSYLNSLSYSFPP